MSRKKKTAWANFLASGFILLALLWQYDLSPEQATQAAMAFIGAVAWVQKALIDGIATEDAADKANGKKPTPPPA